MKTNRPKSISNLFPLVDYVGLDFCENYDTNNDRLLTERWMDIYRALRPKPNIKVKYKRVSITKKINQNIALSSSGNIVDFSRFSSIINEDFPAGNRNEFFKISTMIFGASFSDGVSFVGRENSNLILLNNLMSHFLFSVTLSAWEYRRAIKNETRAPKAAHLKSDMDDLYSSSNLIMSILNRLDDNLLDRAIQNRVPLKDKRRSLTIYSEHNKDGIEKQIAKFRENNFKPQFITLLSLLRDISIDIEKELDHVKGGAHGNVLDRLVGGAELVLLAKASLLVSCYSTMIDIHGENELVSCVAIMLKAFSNGIESQLSLDSDCLNDCKTSSINNMRKINKWREMLDQLLGSDHLSGEDSEKLLILLQGPGPAWRSRLLN